MHTILLLFKFLLNRRLREVRLAKWLQNEPSGLLVWEFYRLDVVLVTQPTVLKQMT